MEQKNIFDYLRLSLRYVMSGFVNVLIIIYLTNNQLYNKPIIDIKEPNNLLFMIAISGLLGIITYTSHHVLLDKLMYKLSLCLFSTFHYVPKKLKKSDFKKKGIFFDIQSFNLITQAYLRKASNKRKIRVLQKELENKLSLLMFLYGICYSCLLYPYIIKHLDLINCCDLCCFDYRFSKIKLIGIGILLITIYFDYRITKREIWLFKFYHQKYK